MKIEMPKGYGDTAINFLRQSILTRVSALKPIAFRIGESSTVLSAGNDVAEDMITFMNNVTSHVFQPVKFGFNFRYTEVLTGEITMDEILTSSEDKKNDVKLCTKDTVILNAFNPVEIDIIFRVSIGKHTKEENIYFVDDILKDDPLSSKDFVVIQSNHSNITDIKIKCEPKDYQTDEYYIDITTRDERSESEILEEALSSIREVFARIGVQNENSLY